MGLAFGLRTRLRRARIHTQAGYTFKRDDRVDNKVRLRIYTPEGVLLARITMTNDQWRELTK